MAGIFERISYQVAQKYLPKLAIPAKLNKFVPAARSFLQGDLAGAANSLLDQFLGPALGFSLEDSPSSLVGGITLAEARQRFDEFASIQHAKKNLWHISVENLSAGTAPDVNLFATEVGYTPITINSEGVRIGSGSFAKVDGTERVEMRVTTYDDKDGTIKRWFADLASGLAKPDGTFGLPIEYLVRVTVTHAFIDEGVGNAYVDTYVMQPGTIEYDHSRRDDALQELQFTLVQFDTFTSL